MGKASTYDRTGRSLNCNTLMLTGADYAEYMRGARRGPQYWPLLPAQWHWRAFVHLQHG